MSSRTLRLTEAEWAAIKPRRAAQVASKPEPATSAPPDRWPLVLRDQIVKAGMPEPYREFTWHQTRGWRLDLAYPAPLKVAIEIDGAVHAIKRMVARDIEKHNALILAGWRYVRVTPAMVRDGSAVELVKAMLGGGQWIEC